jgi:aspartyl protease family protein
MALSHGGRSLLADLAGWSVALMVGACAIVYAPEIKTAGYHFFGLKPPSIATATSPGGSDKTERFGNRTTELSVGSNGHFFTDAEVNGRRIEVMVDTGASIVALTYDDAVAIGVAPSSKDFTHQVSTANGMAKVAPVVLDRLQIGDIMVRRVEAAVIERGKLRTTLLGNSFLSRLSRYEVRSGKLIMEE